MKSKFILIGIIIIIIGIQIIPVERSNPQVINEPEWDSQATKELFFRACNDCHSNKTKWPLYSKIAPISWIISNHVVEGREHFNTSEYKPGFDDSDEAASEVERGSMPISGYVLLHSEAKLTPEEKEKLIKGLKLTFGDKSDEHKKPKFSH